MHPRDFNIDVICTVKNEILNVKLLIEDLFHQTEAPNCVVIVDGGSNDGTYELLVDLVENNDKFLVIQDVVDSEERNSIGPIARGRNIAIKACSSRFILMADAGCRYHENWLRSYSNQIKIGGSVFSGGSKLSVKCTDVDLAVAPMLGFDLPSEGYSAGPTGTCRSLCVSRQLFTQIGGFNELSKTGEDTDFINRATKLSTMIPVPEGAAIYAPNYGVSDACERLIQYAKGDGAFFQSKKRLIRMIVRIGFQASSLLFIVSGCFLVPLLYIAIEGVYAYRSGFSVLLKRSMRSVVFRFAISLITPSLYCVGYIYGLRTRRVASNV